jgi:hypothetical protein
VSDESHCDVIEIGFQNSCISKVGRHLCEQDKETTLIGPKGQIAVPENKAVMSFASRELQCSGSPDWLEATGETTGTFKSP